MNAKIIEENTNYNNKMNNINSSNLQEHIQEQVKFYFLKLIYSIFLATNLPYCLCFRRRRKFK
jgi:hypothetical protein